MKQKDNDLQEILTEFCNTRNEKKEEKVERAGKCGIGCLACIRSHVQKPIVRPQLQE